MEGVPERGGAASRSRARRRAVACDAARTLDAFGARLRGEIDLEALSADMLHVVGEALHPAHARLWPRPPEAER